MKDSTRKKVERAEEKLAKKLTGRCTFFCGDVRCPRECPERVR